MRFYFDHRLYLLFQQLVWEPDRKTWVNKRPIAIDYIYLYSWCTNKTTILRRGTFLSDV